jgi:putative heme-binding domain-containing protein
MHRPTLVAAATLTLAAAGAPLASAQRAPLRAGDRVVLVGGALAERLQHDGWLEARLQIALPKLELSFRNLGFSADTLGVRPRVEGFGTPDEWLARAQADVVFAFWGFNESFAGEAGLTPFRAELTAWIEHVRALSSPEGEPLRVVLFSSVPFANPGNPSLPDGAELNARLARYDAAQAEVAASLGVPFVDLATPLRTRQARGAQGLSINGMHLTAAGNEVLADAVAHAFGVEAHPDGALAEAVRAIVREKDLLWFNRYQATDGYNVHGGRSSLAYDGVTNFEVLQRELAVLDSLCDALDPAIRAVARGEPRPAAPTIGEGSIPPLVEVETNLPGNGPGGTHLYLGGEEAIAKMTPAAGLRVELFADEARFPELANPVQMSFDPRGRLWVAVWPAYPHWRPGGPMNDKLLVFEDDDRDGRADRVQAFADDLHNPTGFEFWNGGVLVANPPDVLFLRDSDGDGRADVRERVLHGISSGDTHHAANSFVLGPDGALYFQEGIFHRSSIESLFGPVRSIDACAWRFEPRTWRVERYVPYDFLNPHGHVFDRFGQDFVTDGTTNENFWVAPSSGHLPQPLKHARYFTYFEQRSRPAAATEILSSRHFPAENQGNLLIANVIGFRGLFQYAFEDAGSGFGAREVEPLLFSADPNFRPVDLEVGPDGAVWFLDWHNALIGHMQHHLRDPSRDHAHGRVYRVVAEGRELLRGEDLSALPTSALVERLGSSEDRVRYRTRIELSARPPDAVEAAVLAWATGRNDEHAQLEALWTLQQHDRADAPLLERVLGSSDPRARAAAVRVVRGLRHKLADPLAYLALAVRDENARVRLEAVVAASFLDSAASAEVALHALERPMDRFLDYALAETLRGLEPRWRAALAAGEPIGRDDPRALACLLSRLSDAELAALRPAAFGGAEAAVWEERLARPGDSESVLSALDALARLHGDTVADELLRAVERADASTDEHADHRLMSLFAAPVSLAETHLRRLSRKGTRASTRRLALRACLQVGGALDATWNEAAADPEALLELLDALRLVDDAALAQALYERVLALLERSPEDEVFGHAALALSALAVPAGREAEAAGVLAARFDEPEARPSLVSALRGLPLARWHEGTRSSLAQALARDFAAAEGQAFDGAAERELLAFADELAPHLSADEARALRLARRPLGPQVVVIRSVPDSLMYDRTEFVVVAGKPVELVFENVDIMPHNLVVTAPGALAIVGRAAERLASDPDAAARDYVPDLPEVLHATRQLRPGESQRLSFVAPASAGDYPYVCTFPGHWLRMNGVMRVVTDYEKLEEPVAAVASAPVAARAFVRDWTFAELATSLGETPARDPAAGRAVFEAASCVRCHTAQGSGGRTGPMLDEVAAKRTTAELLAHVLDPSREIAPEYVNEVFFLRDGTLRAGRVVREDAQMAWVQVDPYAEREPEAVALAEVEERAASSLSSMPSGLLSTFEREEILDLLAYLRSLAPERKSP